MSDVTAITLFAGAGGWDLGFAACGVPILAALDCSRTEALRQLGLAVTPAVAALLVQRGLASLGYQFDKKGAA
jgi:site-specific DNA-cytosine methylase